MNCNLQMTNSGTAHKAKKNYMYYFCLMTTASKMPSHLKCGENSRGSTGPGRLKSSVNWPGGHIWWSLIRNTRERFLIVFPPDVDPRIWTFPSASISQLKWPAMKYEELLSVVRIQRKTKLHCNCS